MADQRSNAGSPSTPGQRPRSVSRTNSTNSPAKRKTKKPSQDNTNGDTAANPDPAVFEAAFVLDDEDADLATTQSATPTEKTVEEEEEETDTNNEKKNNGTSEQNGESKDQNDVGVDEKPKDIPSSAPAELPSHVKTKLRKLEKLEATYPGWLYLEYYIILYVTPCVVCRVSCQLILNSF